MSDTKTIKVQGIGTLGLLGVLFVALKLTGHVDWSWFWVTMPFWGGLGILLAFVAAFAVVGGLALAIAAAVDAVRDRRFKRSRSKAVRR
jgi:hypothetical protein